MQLYPEILDKATQDKAAKVQFFTLNKGVKLQKCCLINC